MQSNGRQGPGERQRTSARRSLDSGRVNSYVSTVASKPAPRRRAEHQLPPGRHNLSRSYVEQNQRQRIIEAVVDVASLAGYAAMNIEDIIGTAGVSRRTFYDHFSSKEDAFLTAIDAVTAELLEQLRSAYEGADSFPAAIRDGLAAFLQFLADEPRYADVLIVEVLAAGPGPIARRNEVMGTFAQLIRQGAERLPSRRHPPELAAQTVIGGINEVVFARVLEGRTTELPSLLSDLAYSLMLPFLGHEQAKREAAKAPRVPASRAVAA